MNIDQTKNLCSKKSIHYNKTIMAGDFPRNPSQRNKPLLSKRCDIVLLNEKRRPWGFFVSSRLPTPPKKKTTAQFLRDLGLPIFLPPGFQATGINILHWPVFHGTVIEVRTSRLGIWSTGVTPKLAVEPTPSEKYVQVKLDCFPPIFGVKNKKIVETTTQNNTP